MRLVFRISVFFVAFAAFAQTPTRLSWQEFRKDPKRVESFRKAVAAMKSRNTADPKSVEFRKSWTYWANMHGYFGAAAKNGTVAQWRRNNDLDDPKYDPDFEGVENTSPPDDTAKAVWDQCQHRTDYFFPWHRLFLYYFERVLQDAAGDPSLRLPYWDYTDPANLAMPEEFRQPTYVAADGSVVDNPLYEKRRDAGWENNSVTLDANDTDIDLALKNRHFLSRTVKTKTVPGYQSTIESSPHGYAHCAVIGCRATVMGAVPYSSNDPIFWIHHCNIDRLWQCWMSKGYKTPEKLMAKRFAYVNERGRLVNKRVSTLFDGSLIDYVYEQPSNCAREDTRPEAAPAAVAMSAETVRSAKAALAEPVSIGSSDAHAITAAITEKRVTLPAAGSLSNPRQFALQESAVLPVGTELVLHDIEFVQHPQANFRIYLQRADDVERRIYVGTLTFFSEEAAGEAHHPQPEDTRVFDVTDELQQLDFEGTATFQVDVIFEAVARRGFNAERTQMVVKEIELRVKEDS